MSSVPAGDEFLPIILIDLNKPWEKVLALGTPVSFPARAVISGRDHASAATGMYFIRRGGVMLSNISAGGKERAHLYMGRGTLFNEIPMLQMTRNYVFTCMESTEAVFFPKKLINTEFTRQYPELIMNMLDSLSRKLRILYVNLSGERIFSSFANVCRALYSMHLFNLVDGKIVPRLARQELAALLGIHRSSLHKALSRLRDEGVIGEYSKKELRIHDVATLLAYASEENDTA